MASDERGYYSSAEDASAGDRVVDPEGFRGTVTVVVVESNSVSVKLDVGGMHRYTADKLRQVRDG